MKHNARLLRQIVISAVVLVVLFALGVILLRQPRSEAQSAPASASSEVSVSNSGSRLVDLQTALVQTRALDNDLLTTGLVSYPADQTVKISPRVAGRIRSVFVRVGDTVAPGQTLAILESPDAAAAQTTFIQDENKLRLARTNLDRSERLFRLGTPEVTQAQSNLDQAHANTRYNKDALDKIQEQARIGGFTEKPIEDAENASVAAESTLAQAQSDLALAQRDHDRKIKLLEIGVAAKTDLEASQNVLEKAQVSVEAGQKQVDLAHQAVTREKKAFATHLYADQTVRTAQSSYEQALLQEMAARTALRLAKTAVQRDLEQSRSDYEAARADDENARQTLKLLGEPSADGSLRITAPSAGVVVERDVNPGQVVDQSQETPWQMFVISNAAVVWVDADVYEQDIESIHAGQGVQIHVGALPNHTFSGRVLHIAPMLDPKSRAIKVRTQIDNRGGLLKDGMFADVTILRPRGNVMPVIPVEAVQHDGDKDYVYIAVNGKYAKRTVKLGTQRAGLCDVLDGVKPGETIVTHGALFLGDQNNSD